MKLSEMCDEIAAEFKKRGAVVRNLKTGRVVETGDDVMNFNSHGELFHIWEWYYGLFPERLPPPSDNPMPGDMSYTPTDGVRVWTGDRWLA